MPDAPEIILNRALAQLLHDADLATYQPTGPVPERGIRLDGVMPTSVDEYTLITPLSPIADGRADMTWRSQIYTRRKGGIAAVRSWSAALRGVLDQKEYVPNVLGIGWAYQFSAIDFDPDSQGRAAVAATYYFRGRRP